MATIVSELTCFHVSQWSSHYSAVGVCMCVCSQWMVIEVIRVTLPELCAGSIIQSSYQQCKLHFLLQIR